MIHFFNDHLKQQQQQKPIRKNGVGKQKANNSENRNFQLALRNNRCTTYNN